MAEATLQPPGGRAISTWTVHCTRCRRAVTLAAGATSGTCTGCGTPVSGLALPTVAALGDAAGLPAGPEAGEASDALVGAQVGRWRLERLLGRGGMGRVYEAREAGGPRRVALKVLSDALAADASFARRFRREAKVLASLTHPHLVEVLDQGEDGGRLWFAMSYVRGENLRRRLERGPLPAAEAGRIAGEIASALAYAHGRGVVHRDLKPENVLLGEDGRVRLADFGLLRLAREDAPEATTRLTRTDVILGTYEYMAPEQRRGADVDGRADVFALGVLLYEMLTGRLPVGRFPPASALAAGLPPAVDAVIHQALAPEPGDRPGSAEAFADALRAALAAPSPGGAPAPTRPLHEVEADERAILADARLLNHVAALATLDRVAGWLLIASLFLPVGGLLLASGRVGLAFAPLGLLLGVGGVLLLKQARRLKAYLPGSREAQLVVSGLLLLLFPLGTALGVYGLIVLLPGGARRAFVRAQARRGWLPSPGAPASPGAPPARPALPAPAPARTPARVETVGPEPRAGAGLLPRLLLAGALLWTLFLSLAVPALVRRTSAAEQASAARLEQLAEAPAVRAAADARARWERQALLGERRERVWTYLATSAAAGALALAVAVHAWRRRAVRRGAGLAFVALAAFAIDAFVLLFVETSSAWLALLR